MASHLWFEMTESRRKTNKISKTTNEVQGLPQKTGAHGRQLQPALRYHEMPLGLGDNSGSATPADEHRPEMHHQCGARNRRENSNALGRTMEELAGRTAFVTGGASGIGLALGRAFAEAGMKVMLADIETGALDVAVESLRAFSPNVRSVPCDVA